MGLSLIRQCANLLIVGAVAFSTYAKSYNRLFGYHGNLEATGSSATHVVLKVVNINLKGCIITNVQVNNNPAAYSDL